MPHRTGPILAFLAALAAPAAAGAQPALEPKAIAIVKAACATLAAAPTMEVTAVNTYERAALNGQPAAAWMSRSAGGGYTHTGYAGGYQHSTSVSSQGVAHSSDAGGYYHGSSATASGTEHTGAYGTTTASYGNDYHQPAVVNNYSASCGNCGGGWGGAAAGAAVGVTAGVAMGAATAHAPPPGYAAPLPAAYAALPVGCLWRPALQRYACGTTWLAPGYGANGVFYQIVPPP